MAGQTALDMSQAAIRSWLQRLQLGARIDTRELVTRFRAGAESIRFLTGERSDAPTLRAFDQASHLTATGAAGLVLSPAVLAVAAEEASLLILRGFGHAGISAARALMTWRMDRSWSATRQIAVLLIYERDPLMTHGTLGRQWMSPVREELLAFLGEDDTAGRLGAACHESGNRSGADEICDALDLLALVRHQ